MLILSAADVRRALPMRAAIEAMVAAFTALSAGEVELPLRTTLHSSQRHGVTLVMPAALRGGEALAVKLISLFDDNPAQGLPRAHAVVLLLDPESGAPAALIEGGALTALRTGAASGAATAVLARLEAATAAVFGAGVQGRTQLEAVCAGRPLRTAWIYDPAAGKAAACAAELSARLGLPVHAAATPAEAVRAADIVCTATPATAPLFADADLRPGTHINAIGAFTPQMQELPPETVARARVVVDQREAALEEAGDLLIPLRQGRITAAHFATELGEVLAGRQPGRTHPDELTLFKSVGLAVQDLLAATAVYDAARTLGLGTLVAL